MRITAASAALISDAVYVYITQGRRIAQHAVVDVVDFGHIEVLLRWAWHAAKRLILDILGSMFIVDLISFVFFGL